MSRNTNKATPFLQEFSALLIARAKAEFDIKIIATSVDRDYKEQMALFSQGRQSLAGVNLLKLSLEGI